MLNFRLVSSALPLSVAVASLQLPAQHNNLPFGHVLFSKFLFVEMFIAMLPWLWLWGGQRGGVNPPLPLWLGWDRHDGTATGALQAGGSPEAERVKGCHAWGRSARLFLQTSMWEQRSIWEMLLLIPCKRSKVRGGNSGGGTVAEAQ